MSVFAFAGCLFNHHDPLRRDVEWDGRTYVGHCRHCGAPIERHGRRNWRRRKVADVGGGTPTSG
jgi:hypothetical protein